MKSSVPKFHAHAAMHWCATSLLKGIPVESGLISERFKSYTGPRPIINMMGPLRFELKSPTPQAGRIPSYPTVPLGKGDYFVYKVCMGYDHPAAAVSLNPEGIKDTLDLLRCYRFTGIGKLPEFLLVPLVIRGNHSATTKTPNRNYHILTYTTSVSLPWLQNRLVSLASSF